MSGVRLAVFAAVLALIACGTILAEGLCFVAALPLAAWVCLGFVRSPAASVEAGRSLSTAFAEAGRPIRVCVRLRNAGASIDLLRVADRSPEKARIVEGLGCWKGSLAAGGTAEFAYSIVLERGVHRFGDIAVAAQDPFGAAERKIGLPCPNEVIVYPARVAVRALRFGAGSARPFGGTSRTKRAGGGTDFSGTRDYVPGDPVRDLNWRAEALWGRPIVNVFEEERAIDVGVLLDARSIAYETSAQFEEAVRAAAAYADRLLAAGNRVSFLSYGSSIEWTPPGSGGMQRWLVRKAASRAALGSHAAFERFDAVPPKIFPPKSAILIVSPLLREDIPPLRSLKALGYSVAVLRLSGTRPRPLAAVTGGSDASPPAAGRGASTADFTASLGARIAEIEETLVDGRLLAAGMEVLRWKPSVEHGRRRADSEGKVV